MILLDDKILRFLTKLTKNELTLYLSIMRYISGGLDIPIDHIQKLLKFSDEKMSLVFKKLVEKQLFEISSENLDCIDLIGESSQKLILKNSSGQKARAIIYNNILNINKEQDYKSNKSIIESSSTQLDKNQQGITVNLKNRLGTLRRESLKLEAINLVNYFADALYDLHHIAKTREWRVKQLAIARKVLKAYKLNLSEWKEAIDYFIAQEFWQDKLNSLKQIENNIHQYTARAKQVKHTSTRVRSIK